MHTLSFIQIIDVMKILKTNDKVRILIGAEDRNRMAEDLRKSFGLNYSVVEADPKNILPRDMNDMLYGFFNYNGRNVLVTSDLNAALENIPVNLRNHFFVFQFSGKL